MMSDTTAQAFSPKCPRCQNNLRYVEATNVWVCDSDQVSYPGNSWCTKCASPNELAARFCTSCGAPLAGTIPRTSFGRLFSYSYRVWRENPVIILPTLLVNAASLASQTVIIAVLVGLISYVTLSGDLQRMISSFRYSGIFGGFSEPAITVFGGVESTVYSIFLIVSLAVVVWIILQTLLGSLATSLEYSAYVQVIRNRSVSIREFLDDGLRDWRRMLSAYFLVNLLVWGPILVAYFLLVVGLLSVLTRVFGQFPGSNGGFAGAIGLLIIAAVTGLLGFVMWAVTTFTFPAVIFNGKSGLAAVRSGFQTVRRSSGAWIGYGFLRLGLVVVLSTAGVFLRDVGVTISALTSALIVVSLTPILHMLKTSIHAAAHDQALGPEMVRRVAEPEVIPTWNLFLARRVAPVFREALGAVAKYAVNPRNLPFHLAAAFVFFGSYFFGEYVSNHGLADLLSGFGIGSGRINPVFSQLQPSVLSLEFFFHNWMVSINTGLAGAVFGVPTIVTLFFNGWLVGVLRPVFLNVNMFLAAILPHGIIEIPAFLISGSAGIRFGFLTAKAMRSKGEARISEIRNALRETTYIVMGLAPLYLVAGIVEAVITPSIMRMAGSLLI